MPITSNSVLPPLLTLTPMLTSVLTPYLKSATGDVPKVIGRQHSAGNVGVKGSFGTGYGLFVLFPARLQLVFSGQATKVKSKEART